MIKKLSILGLLLIPSFSFAINELNPAGMGQNIGGDTTNFCVVKSDLSFDCSETDNVLASYTNGGNANIGTSFWWRNDGLGFYYSWNGGSLQGVITGFTFCPGNYIDSDSFSQYRNGCTDTLTYYQFREYVSSHQIKKWGWATFYAYRGNGGPVFVFDEGAFRLSFDIGGNNYSSLLYGIYSLKDFGLSGNPMNASYSNVGIIDSPISNINIPIPDGPGIDDYTYIPVKTGDRILYFEEEYNLRKNICFVGTKDLTSVYEDKIPFNEGTGYTIFDMYSNLFNENNLSVYEVGTFWQEWYLNYQVWFQKKYGLPSMVAYYNGPGNYGINKGPDLSNPFLGNLSAYYFIASNLALGNYPSDINGQKVAYYCYLKLGLSSFSNDGGNISINDDHDESYDENIAVYTRNQINIRNQTTGGTVINSANWDGSPLDYYTGGNYTDFDSFFSDNFTRFKGLFNLRNSDYGLGFIPSYIVIFLMGIILFRFLRH